MSLIGIEIYNYEKDGFYANIKKPSDIFGDCIISDLPDMQSE